ncbi:MAG: 4Fe-4S dicluster domain-containing protein [Acidobacteria bacterium]|nr:4Fe-4S dicluster domain-containing protein [Acidobacteriota bacterium]
METFLTFAIALVVTLFFVSRYVKKMAPTADGQAAAAPAGPSAACPRCGHAVPQGSTFCGKCGAPLDLWKVHRATVAEASGSKTAEKGKPRPVINASLCIGCGTCVDVCPEQGALAVMGGKAILAAPEKCVGHAKCSESCPTSAIGLAFGGALQTIKVPMVDETFQTNVPGVFIVGELGGMGLIKTAINEGRLVIDGIARRMRPEPAPTASAGHGADGYDFEDPQAGVTDSRESGGTLDSPADVVIVGAGPAGLSAALTAKQLGLRYLAFDQAEVASTIKQYPRHKFLMAEPVSMPLYGNLYIADGTKESLVSVWENILANTGVQVQTQERVENVRRDGEALEVTTSRNRYYGRHVVLAMGKRGTPRRLGASGEGLAKVAYRLIEAETYEDDDILVVGGGDSAVEAALALSRSGRNRVTLSYRKDDFSRVRARNQQFLAEAEQKGLLAVERGSHVLEISPDAVVLETKQGRKTLPNDYVFILIGGESPEGFLRQIGVEIVEKSVTA